MALSAPVSLPDWVSVPAALADAYPYSKTAPRALPPSGAAVVSCRWHEGGDLDHCRVLSESPKAVGFGRRAAVVATLSRAPTPPASAVSPTSEVTIPVTFDGQAAAAAGDPKLGGHVLNAPHWRMRPNPTDIMRYYPDRAMRMNAAGQVTVACYVVITGELEGCRIVSEAPEGFGFGDSALALAKLFSIRGYIAPKTIDGQPVADGLLVLPLNFDLPAPMTALPAQPSPAAKP